MDQLELPKNASLDPFFILIDQLDKLQEKVSNKVEHTLMLFPFCSLQTFNVLYSVPLCWRFQSDNVSDRADIVSDETKMTKQEAEALQEEAEDAALLANGLWNNYLVEIVFDRNWQLKTY